MRRCLDLILAIVFFANPVAAQDTFATVRLDGNAVFQVGPSDEEDDAAGRARRIETRLAGLLRNLDALAPPVARQTQAGWTVSVSGVPVVTVTQRDAEDNRTSEAALANRWAAALERSLSRARERRLGRAGRFGAEMRSMAGLSPPAKTLRLAA